jgi:hypothetical protein
MSENNLRSYVPSAFAYAGAMASDIAAIAGMLNLTPELIAGALAEEADTYFTEDGIKHALDVKQDEETTKISHVELEKDYLEILSLGIINDKTLFNTLLHPVMRDLGPGNIRLGVAIQGNRMKEKSLDFTKL